MALVVTNAHPTGLPDISNSFERVSQGAYPKFPSLWVGATALFAYVFLHMADTGNKELSGIAEHGNKGPWIPRQSMTLLQPLTSPKTKRPRDIHSGRTHRDTRLIAQRPAFRPARIQIRSG